MVDMKRQYPTWWGRTLMKHVHPCVCSFSRYRARLERRGPELPADERERFTKQYELVVRIVAA